jgi:hypothetical protein
VLPHLDKPEVSGTTKTVPVKMILSPALALSTISFLPEMRRRSRGHRTHLQITSMHRGMLPAGISSAFSCTRSVCQSTKVDWSGRSWKSLEEHWLLRQMGGNVY